LITTFEDVSCGFPPAHLLHDLAHLISSRLMKVGAVKILNRPVVILEGVKGMSSEYKSYAIICQSL